MGGVFGVYERMRLGLGWNDVTVFVAPCTVTCRFLALLCFADLFFDTVLPKAALFITRSRSLGSFHAGGVSFFPEIEVLRRLEFCEAEKSTPTQMFLI